MIVFTGILCAGLFGFEIMYPLLKKHAMPRIKPKVHMAVGVLTVFAAFFHWTMAGTNLHFGPGLLALALLLATAASGIILKKTKRRKVYKRMHVALSLITLAILVFHILQEVLLR